MASQDVRFMFICRGARIFIMHALPDTLIRDAKTSSISADYQELFIRTVEPLVQEHHADCLANSPTTCSSCDGPATRILMTPMSYLHRTPPHLVVAVTSLCERSDCERDIRADTEQGPVEETTVPTEPALDFFCEYCGIVGALRDCPSCGLVAYCNEEHERADWQNHKPTCNDE